MLENIEKDKNVLYNEEKTGECFKMSRKIGLVIYGLSVLDGENRVLLNNIHGKSLIEILQRYIEENMSKRLRDSKKELVFQFDKIQVETVENNSRQVEYEVLFGRVKTGEYGIESELVNVTTGDVYKRTQDQADMMPFGFCIALPKGEVSSSVIILQTTGVYGIKTSLQRQLQECIAKTNSRWNISFNPITPKAYIDRYFKNGILQKIRMIRYEIPEDISNRIGIDYGVRKTKEERIIHKPLGFVERNSRILREWILGQRSHTNIIEIEGYKYDDLKLEFSLGKITKTFNLGNLNSAIISEDITSKVNIIGGHPEFDNLKQVMKNTAREYLIGMGLIVE